MMTCKGICDRYIFQRSSNSLVYAMGGKRCSHCCIYIKWDGIYCPCCGIKLRVRSQRGKKARARIKAKKKVQA